MELLYSAVGKTGESRFVECRMRGSGLNMLTWEACQHPNVDVCSCAPKTYRDWRIL